MADRRAEAARFHRASAMLARASGRFDLAQLWEEHAHWTEHGERLRDFRGLQISGIGLGVPTVPYDVAMEAVRYLYAGPDETEVRHG